MFSNYNFDVNGVQKELFIPALQLAIKGHRDTYSSGPLDFYYIIKAHQFGIFWTNPKNCDLPLIKLPYKMDINTFSEFVSNWLFSLEKQERAEKTYDGDGSTAPAWRISTESDWGFYKHYSIVTISAEWAIYAK
jgi:hypothetical protein